jgi:alpha-mannosidase
VIPAAYDLNDPLILRRVSGGAGNGIASDSLVSTSAPNVVVETIKRAEDGNGLIVRMYEDHRNRGRVIVKTAFALAEAYHCNLLEENERSLPVRDNEVHLDVRPYQIITLRLVPRRT